MALLPIAAQAHGDITSMNAFYGGMLHPFLNVPHMMVLGGLGLWLGEQRPLKLGAPMLALAVCAGMSLLLANGQFGLPRVGSPFPSLLATMSMALGALVALSTQRAQWLQYYMRSLLAGLAAVLVGLDSGVDGAPKPGALLLFTAGVWLTMVLLVGNLAHYTSLAFIRDTFKAGEKGRCTQIGVRILGAWLFAASLMVLAFYAKGPSVRT